MFILFEADVVLSVASLASDPDVAVAVSAAAGFASVLAASAPVFLQETRAAKDRQSSNANKTDNFFMIFLLQPGVTQLLYSKKISK